MNESRASSARANRAARRNYLVMSIVAVLALAVPVIAFVVLSD